MLLNIISKKVTFQSFWIFGCNVCSVVSGANAASCMVWCIPNMKFYSEILLVYLLGKFGTKI